MLVSDEPVSRWSVDNALRELTLGTSKLFRQVRDLENENERLRWDLEEAKKKECHHVEDPMDDYNYTGDEEV